MKSRLLLSLLVPGVVLLGTTARATAVEQPSEAPYYLLEPVPTAKSDCDPCIIQEASVTLGEPWAAKDGCGCDAKSACSCEKTQALNKAAAGAYKGVFYDNNFDYLCDPCYCDWHLGERMKRMCVVPWMTVDVGGQYRARLHNERNMRNVPSPLVGFPGPPRPVLGLTGFDDDFLLHRTRLYVNTEIGQRVRVYAEMLDATSQFEEFAPRPIEENRLEVQNLFADVVAWQGCRGDLTFRFGRQEVILGSQRLVSPLDWANTRRTFEGARLMWKGENWDVDGLWVRPMRHIEKDLDPPNLDRQLYGVYSTYKGLCQDKVDLYWLAYDDSAVGFRDDTIAARYYGNREAWLYEAEGGFQFGKNPDDSDHSAGFFTLGLGRKFPCVAWKPTLWAYYDWASGDNTLNNGFNHYEPLAHKYLGFMDFFGRRNIESPNVLLTLQPHEKVQLLAWYYYFRLQNGNDVPYTVVMTPYIDLPGGTGVKDLGHEIDLALAWSMTSRTELLFGYSHFFAGEFYNSDPALVPLPNHADFFYTQFTVNF